MCCAITIVVFVDLGVVMFLSSFGEHPCLYYNARFTQCKTRFSFVLYQIQTMLGLFGEDASSEGF